MKEPETTLKRQRRHVEAIAIARKLLNLTVTISSRPLLHGFLMTVTAVIPFNYMYTAVCNTSYSSWGRCLTFALSMFTQFRFIAMHFINSRAFDPIVNPISDFICMTINSSLRMNLTWLFYDQLEQYQYIMLFILMQFSLCPSLVYELCKPQNRTLKFAIRHHLASTIPVAVIVWIGFCIMAGAFYFGRLTNNLDNQWANSVLTIVYVGLVSPAINGALAFQIKGLGAWKKIRDKFEQTGVTLEKTVFLEVKR
ncbi:hypothetical protein HDU76_000559 [Blyttiomyces sp. JEL0837]|nr:hypothetical protein HDU76_000559 [Blyttiomyces sp. JEL0837]